MRVHDSEQPAWRMPGVNLIIFYLDAVLQRHDNLFVIPAKAGIQSFCSQTSMKKLDLFAFISLDVASHYHFEQLVLHQATL